MSFFGYGNQTPGANINGDYVNKDSSSYAGQFGSNQIPTSCMRGGKKIKNKFNLKNKIKNITKQYKMTPKKKNLTKKNIMKHLSKSRMMSKSMGGRKRMMSKSMGGRKRMSRRGKLMSRGRGQKGGYYSQFGSNVPNTPSYSTGGILSASESALANPVPFKILGGSANCIDNYNHFTGKGIQTV